MTYTAPTDAFRFDQYRSAVEAKRVFITGAGKDGGIGQAFALSAGLNGAASVGVHFHRSYEDGFDLVNQLRAEGVNAFPVQADVTNLRDLWASRSYVIEQMGGLPPNLVICNSGLTESGYSFGRALKEEEGEPSAVRRARVRQHFLDNLDESRLVLDTKVDGFLASTHLWAGEAVHANEPIQFVYVSSRQAIDPGQSVPGYAISNWAVLQLPRVLKVNLGRSADLVQSFSLMFPFIRTGMTDQYADNDRVFGRWQPRMLEPSEMAQAFMSLLARPGEETDNGMFELMVDPSDDDADIELTWRQVKFNLAEEHLAWSAENPLRF
ncbi:MAG: SDR family oxidoreductase [Acidimicrobiales bacterium]|nr:SDR family oxidoreductase [Acidimicrobiales bacterium]RPH17305.1 MAG: SDR family oxidoreductase [Actinobacteria bacterium TMED270]RPH17679.1 MAG: SDR family oxidoreductase [Actinobacteria bacterium TMED270]|tara:strand:+ start:2484 stop:3452 length:969 start_codon:yes stop_codon:yes gene_type:complete